MVANYLMVLLQEVTRYLLNLLEPKLKGRVFHHLPRYAIILNFSTFLFFFIFLYTIHIYFFNYYFSYKIIDTSKCCRNA